jgi:FkbM family methyltransferase
MFSGLATIIQLACNYRGGHGTSKIKVFSTLFRLYSKSWLQKNKTPVAAQLNKFHVSGFDFPTVIGLYQDIFIRQHYRFQLSDNNAVIFDGGANIGMATLYFKERFPDASIVAFEPNAEIFDVLRLNVSVNKLQNVRLVNAALAKNNGNVAFFTPDKRGSINGTILTRQDYQGTTVEAVKLSSYIKEHSNNLVKLDIEGAELMVIEDLVESDKIKYVAEICAELHSTLGEGRALVFDILAEHGFNHEVISVDSPGPEQNVIVRFSRKLYL